ncbi:fibronectin type-III domain-containing protein 3A isoform X2 [Esox lucius]|uniref:Fibronectin type-III domain-containing protein n=1 Tax=Esox lucius TaxID=8010 RepID=A0A6Q2Z200_ESOLU|nr:fibronectin type-III domain-containing protein 3A isoform X2 [Esox lucius]XP_028975229.2 fibronectin type-III domain-containing protein 3A isoform X2 [Esox lucius]
MAEHPPPLESGQILSPDVPLLASPPPGMVNGDGPQQVILVQVNPGEAFTIRREDGQFQCITGPAQVPMMSPNGSVPPIYVPPGYVSQIIEENGVRRVLVLPQQPEFHPGGHSPLHHPPPPPHAHLPTFIPHHPMMPHPPHIYSSMAGGVGDMGSQYIPQYHPAHIYSEQVSTDPHSPHGRPLPFAHRDERASKTYERLQKKLKDRQGGERGGQMKDSPPPSPQKSGSSPPSMDNVHNGVGGKGLEAEHGQTSRGPEATELDAETQALQALLNTISKPAITDIQARGAVLSWVAPSRGQGEGDNPERDAPSSLEPLSYEVSISYNGKGGTYTSVYSGEELSATLKDLRPATDYHVRVVAVCPCLQGSPSEPVAFTTLSCEPDPPSPPRKASGSKSSTLVLQWKAPCDNGSKIQNYILQWDEGKGTGVYEQCYYGPQKQYRVTKLSPASRYSFRLAAKNDMGVSEFSEVVDLYTSCSVPSPPLPPELVKAGVTWLCLTWQRPSASPKEDDIYYTLEMDDDEGYGFQPRYDGDERSCTVKNLHRSTKYKFRVAAYNTEGKSNPSQVAEFTTCPDRPGGPCRPVIKGRALPTSFRLAWEPPEDNGGAEVTKYVVEISEGLSGLSWELGYSGPALEHLCDGLLPGHSYQTRVYCMSEGGQSPLSETLQVQTPAVPPGQCQPPRVVGKPKAREVQLRWAPPGVDGGSPVSLYSVEVCGLGPQGSAGQEEFREVYQGSEVDCTVGNLLPGRIYGFRLRASNKAGFGPHSERSEVTTGPGAPEPCKAPHITCKSPTVAVVSWEVPVSNGAPVSEYRVEWGAAEGTMQVCYSGASLTHEVKGLLPATIYFCRVQAVNVAGVGPFSEAVLCQTPPSVPAAVSLVHALKEAELRGFHNSPDQEEEEEEEEEEDDEDRPPVPPLYSPSTCLGVRWEAPCDHGAEITTYIIDLGERQPISVGPVTKHIIQNLQPDTSYRIRIQALNSLGAGPFSHTFKLKTKPLPPQPPRLECTAFSHQTLRLKWGDGPSKATPSDALQYQLQMADKSGRFVCLYRGPCHTHKVQRLSESTSYMFRVQAFNEAGQGLFSPAYTFTTPRSPPAPLKAPKVERVEDMPSVCEVSWELLLPMKGDPIIYTLQSMMGNSEYKQVYKGPASSCQVPGLQPNSEYRFRVCAVRQCQDAPELSGPYSPTVVLSPQRSELSAGSLSGAGPRAGADVARPIRTPLSDEQWAALILMLFAVISILIAFVIQYFVIK